MSDQPLDLNTSSNSNSNNTMINSNDNVVVMMEHDKLSDEPISKKSKLNQSTTEAEITSIDKKKLEDRLGCILVCCVCLDGSKLSIYQVNFYLQLIFRFKKSFLKVY